MAFVSCKVQRQETSELGKDVSSAYLGRRPPLLLHHHLCCVLSLLLLLRCLEITLSFYFSSLPTNPSLYSSPSLALSSPMAPCDVSFFGCRRLELAGHSYGTSTTAPVGWITPRAAASVAGQEVAWGRGTGGQMPIYQQVQQDAGGLSRKPSAALAAGRVPPPASRVWSPREGDADASFYCIPPRLLLDFYPLTCLVWQHALISQGENDVETFLFLPFRASPRMHMDLYGRTHHMAIQVLIFS